MSAVLLLDPTLLLTFVQVAEARSFTEAGRRLGLRQSTVSQHVRKLEATVGRRLLLRDTHSVALTADGDAMLGHARAILEANERVRRHFAGSELRGRVRFGAAEDFVMTRLPDVLREFTRQHALVDLELTVALSGTLFELLDAGQLDLILGKRRPGGDRGLLVRREPLVWTGTSQALADPERPLPLVLYPEPSISRAIALDALTRAGRSWRITCTSGSLSGLRAAALAGLGVTVQPRATITAGLDELPAGPGLPELGTIEFVAAGATGSRGPAAELARSLVESGNRLGFGVG